MTRDQSWSACPTVLSVARDPRHGFSKQPQLSIKLLVGLGVEGDVHCGATVRHLYDMRRDRSRPNLRQVHLVQAELLDDISAAGFALSPGDLGENITTQGLDLTSLPRGARLHLGEQAVVEMTGLRAPCVKLDRRQQGLRAVVTQRRGGIGSVTRASAMAIVVVEGLVQAGDAIRVALPAQPFQVLALV